MSSPAKLRALGRPGRGTGALVLVTEDQASFFQVIGRNLDYHAVAGKSLNPIFLHPSSRVGDEFVTVIELNAIAGVRQYLEDEAFELQEFFLRHVMILLIGRRNVEQLRQRPARTAHGDSEKQPIPAQQRS
jgi:hypothetical protein